jgi:hypothetical protein
MTDTTTAAARWSCTQVENLGAAEITCERCKSQSVRYVHSMRHPSFPGVLRCGWSCAGDLEGDLGAARARELEFRRQRKAAQAWEKVLPATWCKTWPVSRNGNEYKWHAQFLTVVYKYGGGWSVMIEHTKTKRQAHSGRVYPSVEAAKLAALDAIHQEMGNQAACVMS